MSSSQNDDIVQQEDDIFEKLGNYDFQNEPLPFYKDMARQQLAISADSPFSQLETKNTEAQLRRLKEERAALLRDETRAIRQQLDLVKSRLNELKNPKPAADDKPTSKQTPSNRTIDLPQFTKCDKVVSNANDESGAVGVGKSSLEPTVANERLIQRCPPAPKTRHTEAKLRPLTGKADCPNCACDRRSSVCSQCMSLSTFRQSKGSRNSNSNGKKNIGSAITPPGASKPKWFTYEDERPIRPAKVESKTLATVEVVVDDRVVPGRVYNISKSLDEKRTKLAQAIDDLESTLEQVKGKGEKLDKERKIVQLYRDQWKFGPSIGGPSASSREKLGLKQQNRNYESRWDPSLSRDSKSVSGYDYIGSTMKLRQYGSSTSNNNRQQTSKNSRLAQAHSRSKSLESLKPPATKAKNTNNLQRAFDNFHTGKSISEIDLSPETRVARRDGEEDDDIEVVDEMQIEESNGDESRESSPGPALSIGGNNGQAKESEVESKPQPKDDNSRDKKVQRMSWIPVFGETETKTTIKRDTKRKVQVIKPGDVILEPRQQNKAPPAPGHRRHIVIHSTSKNQRPKSGSNNSANDNVTNYKTTGLGGDRVVTEAARQLRFASDLLEQEQRDCRTKNQLIINKTKQAPIPAPRRTTSPATTMPKATIRQKDNQRPVNGAVAATEIGRLEEMVNEQQKLLNQLIQSQERCQTSPMAQCYTSSCSHHSQRCNSTSSPADHLTDTNTKTLVGSLRDRLNKTKARLARTLEAEREKHQQLELKVDSSLRRQSNLEAENDLLKKSLSKCIDTCLKDISSTFESLGDTIADSICKQQPDVVDDDGDGGSGGSIVGLSSAAQLIADNRHLQQMKSHIETIELQRKRIFEELSKEKQRSNRLELQLKESQCQLNALTESKHRLETRLMHTSADNDINMEQTATTSSNSLPNDHKSQPITSQPNNSKQTTLDSSQTTTGSGTDLDDTYSSVDVYRRYIQSMSPDIESIRRERKMILSEFDNIKKMLSEIDK